MRTVILDDVPFQIDRDALVRRLHIGTDSDYVADLRQLAEEAEHIARPRAMYKLGYVESRGEDTVVIDGITFASRILRVNLDQAHRVFLYVATCGTEIAEWGRSLGDLLHQYWAETIQEEALRAASQAMHRHMVECYRLGKTATMAPGSLSEWPLSEQRALFSCLGDVREAIGVELSDSLLMIPAKSVSGILFPTEESFESCQLCPRDNCPGRRAPYDRTLYDRRYRAG
jgi:cobalamin-dependent methionine synthase I